MAINFDASHVFLDIQAATRDEALAFAADKAVELGASNDAAALLEGLKAREAEGTTGMMSGFAIPHCKSASVSEPCVVVMRFKSGIDWETMDKSEVKAAIALFIPDGEVGTENLSILSKIAVMLMHEDFCHAILSASDPDEAAKAVSDGLAK